MELPQSLPFGTTQVRKATHDFLSLYSHSSLPQDPRPSNGDFLKTQNFLQPLEGEQKNSTKDDVVVDVNAEPQTVAPSTSVVEHVLPGGIGTYSISCVPYFTPKVPKPEENCVPVVSVTSSNRNDSNCRSYSGGSFMLWAESTTEQGHSRKENLGGVNLVKAPSKVGQWPLDRPSRSSSNHRSSVGSLSSSQALALKNQSFMEKLKSAKRTHSMEEEYEEALNFQKDSNSCLAGQLQVKVDGKNSDQKANTPRSKHSATEQRRRCKINDRFQMLKEVIPPSDQKRDKASFLFEVIEYIQFLQAKVNHYEGPYSGLKSKPAKLNMWSNNHDQPEVANGVWNPLFMSGVMLDEKVRAGSLNAPRNTQTQEECTMINSINFKAVDPQSGLVTKAEPISSLQPNVNTPFSSCCVVAQPPTRIPDAGRISLPQLQLRQSRTPDCEPSATGVKLKDQEPVIEGGTINISSIYSQGILNTLTCALQNSGVDLSQATISVQVDVGKRAKNKRSTLDSLLKSVQVPCNDQSLLQRRAESTSSEPDQSAKKRKTG